MLIRCGHCNNQAICEKQNYNGELIFCDTGKPNEKFIYRYSLADKLHRAVLERLLDPKNVAKGEFFKNIDRLLVLTKDELYELNDAYDGGAAQRIIEECGDVGAYLAAIIDAVGEDK